MIGEVARLLNLDGDWIANLEDLDVVGSFPEPGCPFFAVIPGDAGLEIRPGPVLLELDRGTRYPAEIECVNGPENSPPTPVRVSGVLGASET